MVTRPEPRTTTLALALFASSLFACKMFKKGEEEQLPVVPSATVAPAVSQAAAPPPKEEPPAPAAALKLGDVKRFADKEKKVEGVVKVLEADAKVFNEPDLKAQHVAELNKDIFVSRLATFDDFVLVEFPSGVGELSPGWVQAKVLCDPDAKVSQDKVKQQDSAVKLVTDKKEADTDQKAAEGTTGTVKADDKPAEGTTGTVKQDDTPTEGTTGAVQEEAGTSTSTTGGRVRRKKRP